MPALTVHTHYRIDVPTQRKDVRQYYRLLYRMARVYLRDIDRRDNPGNQFMLEFGNAGVFTRQRVGKIWYSVESSR